ncbi:MAG: hypothetical protein QM804_13610 [Propionicimonas sp.]
MKLIRFAALASGLAMTGALLVPATAQAAAPAAPKPKPVRVKVDVDGDGRKDAVTVTKLSSTRYEIKVTTAKKRTSSIKITSTFESDWGANPYWGAAKLDKVKGHELLVATGGGDGWTTTVLTWRKNKLVRQAAPKDRSSKYSWYAAALPDWLLSGYRFYNKSGKRYVEQYTLFKMGTPRWEGQLTTSKWTSKGWKKVGKTKTVSLTNAQAKKYNNGGFIGVKIVARP